jgi:hypothetical protein
VETLQAPFPAPLISCPFLAQALRQPATTVSALPENLNNIVTAFKMVTYVFCITSLCSPSCCTACHPCCGNLNRFQILNYATNSCSTLQARCRQCPKRSTLTRTGSGVAFRRQVAQHSTSGLRVFLFKLRTGSELTSNFYVRSASMHAQVWVAATIRDGKMFWSADSDSALTKVPGIWLGKTYIAGCTN